MSDETLISPPHEMTDLLRSGSVPTDENILEQLTTGISFLTDFWEKEYLQEYIREGGSKIKMITGRRGSGKTHLLKYTSLLARRENYVTVEFSARDVWLHDFSMIYREILKQCHLEECLHRCCCRIIENCGFQPEDIPEGQTFIDYLSRQNLADAITRREIRLQLKQLFLDDPIIDNNFALACSLLAGGFLGHPVLENQNHELLLRWLSGDQTVKIPALRALGLSPTKITKVNARHMLRSLAEIIRIGGYSGLLVTIDDLEILVGKSSLEPIHYTRIKREDTYESLRQLIDDIDSMQNIFFLFGFDRELLDNESTGIKSYQALWMRIQNEIVSRRFNRFADIVDMDRLGSQIYTPDVIQEMSERLTSAAAHNCELKASPLNQERITQILQASKTGSLGIPGLVNRATLEVCTDV